MATISREIDYPTGDGKPMAETDLHRDLMFDLIKTLQEHYANDPLTYVSGNLLLFYEEGNKRRHLAPDVFVVRGIPKRERVNYLLWEEGKGPDLVIELTSKTTKREDQSTKRDLYRDVLRVSEYFLFDPLAEYLKPPLQGFRLLNGEYAPIELVASRLPSVVTGLHLEARGKSLRLYSPNLGRILPTPIERATEAEVEVERLRKEIETLRRSAEGKVTR
jgi:Uma2 family endonuclease